MKTLTELEEHIKKEKRAMLLVNTQSRRGEDTLASAKKLLEEQGFRFLGTYPVQNPKLLNMTIREIMREKPALLILGSGDGTVSEVTNHLAYTDTVLGYLPMGTTNNFARSLEIPFDLRDAIATLSSGRVAEVDLGTINGRYFANVASIGISAEVAATVPSSLKRYVGRFAYTLTGIQSFLGHQPFKSKVIAENTTHEIETHQLIIANGKFHSGTLIAQDASIDNARLAVFPLGNPSRWHLASNVVQFMFANKGTQKEEKFITAKEILILTDPPREVEIDGEIKAMTPIKAAIAPKALKVIVPQSYNG